MDPWDRLGGIALKTLGLLLGLLKGSEDDPLRDVGTVAGDAVGVRVTFCPTESMERSKILLGVLTVSSSDPSA